MTPQRLSECLALIRWSPATLAEAMSLSPEVIDRWLEGSRPIPSRVASWTEALCFTHESADLLRPSLPSEDGDDDDDEDQIVETLEHVPVYSYNLLRRLSQGPVLLRTLFGTDDEAAVFFLVSRGLATRDEEHLNATTAGRKIGEVAHGADRI